MDWSYDLLTEPNGPSSAACPSSPASLSLEAAELVCAVDPVDSVDVLDLLSRLVEKSLVVTEPTGDGRYRLLETVRQYARDRLIEVGRGRGGPAPPSEPVPRARRAGRPGVLPRRRSRGRGSTASTSSTTTFGPPCNGASTSRAKRGRGAPDRGRPVAVLGDPGPPLRRPRLARADAGRSGRARAPAARADALTGAAVLASMQGDDAAAVGFHEREPRRPAPSSATRTASRTPLNNLANTAVRQGDTRPGPRRSTRSASRSPASSATSAAWRSPSSISPTSRPSLGDVAAARAGSTRDPRHLRRGSAIAGWRPSPSTSSRWSWPARATAWPPGPSSTRRSPRWRELGDQRGVARVLTHLADVASLEGDPARRPARRSARAWRSARSSATCPGSRPRWRSWPEPGGRSAGSRPPG